MLLRVLVLVCLFWCFAQRPVLAASNAVPSPDAVEALEPAQTWLLRFLEEPKPERADDLLFRMTGMAARDPDNEIQPETKTDGKEFLAELEKRFGPAGIDTSSVEIPEYLEDYYVFWRAEDIDGDRDDDLVLYRVVGTDHCDDYEFYVNTGRSLVPLEQVYPAFTSDIASVTTEGKYQFCLAPYLSTIKLKRRTYLLLIGTAYGDVAREFGSALMFSIYRFGGHGAVYKARTVLPYKPSLELETTKVSLCSGGACDWVKANAEKLRDAYWDLRRQPIKDYRNPRNYADNPITRDLIADSGKLSPWTTKSGVIRLPKSLEMEIRRRIKFGIRGNQWPEYFPLTLAGDLYLVRVAERDDRFSDSCCGVAVFKVMDGELAPVVMGVTKTYLTWREPVQTYEKTLN